MKLFLRYLLILGLFSIVTVEGTNSHGQTKSDLIVNFAYAQGIIRQGDIWKIYLSVTDPEGDMDRIFFRVRPSGGGSDHFKRDFIILKKEMKKEFTGHFALHTRHHEPLDDFVLEVSIVGRKGNERKTFLFPVEFESSPEPMKPLPSDMEKELNRRIGTISFDWELRD